MNTFITGQEENRPPFISDGACKNFYGVGKGVKKYLTLFFNSKKYACVHYLINNIYTFSILQAPRNHRIGGIEEKTSSIGNKGGGPLVSSRGGYIMASDVEYATTALQKERSSERLAYHNFRRLDKIYQAGKCAEDDLFETVFALKILRMKKVMAKYGRLILTREQASEIWKVSE